MAALDLVQCDHATAHRVHAGRSHAARGPARDRSVTRVTKPIWFSGVDLDALNGRHAKDINGHIGIEMTAFGPDWLAARMPADGRTRQPMGILHGGASVVLAETLASAAANLCVDPEKAYCVGQEVNANHLRAVT